MFGIYTQFGFSSKYSCNKNCTNSNFINSIRNRANFAVRGPTSLPLEQMLVVILPMSYFTKTAHFEHTENENL